MPFLRRAAHRTKVEATATEKIASPAYTPLSPTYGEDHKYKRHSHNGEHYRKAGSPIGYVVCLTQVRQCRLGALAPFSKPCKVVPVPHEPFWSTAVVKYVRQAVQETNVRPATTKKKATPAYNTATSLARARSAKASPTTVSNNAKPILQFGKSDPSPAVLARLGVPTTSGAESSVNRAEPRNGGERILVIVQVIDPAPTPVA